MEAAACQFRMCKLIVNKSQNNPDLIEGNSNEEIPMRLSEQYISSKKILDSVHNRQTTKAIQETTSNRPTTGVNHLMMNKSIISDETKVFIKSQPY